MLIQKMLLACGRKGKKGKTRRNIERKDEEKRVKVKEHG